MTMDRRRFIKVAGIAGLAVMAPIAVREGRAGSARYKGPFWIMLNAGGGWDPTMLCDPKGGDPMDPKAVNHYDPKQIGTAGPISYAPTTLDDNGITIMSCEKFFKAHHQRLLVLNGVDNATNNHDAGSRTTWSGQLSEGHPSFAAMVAAHASAAKPIPLAYLSSGGYDATQGLVSLTRLGGSDAIQRIAFTNRMNPGDTKSDTYHSNNTASRIAAAQDARIKALQAKQTLPTVGQAMGSLFLARQGDDGIAALGQELNNTKLVQFPDDFPELQGVGGNGGIEGLCRQAQIALLAFKSGVAVSANLDIGGFDTHGDHDNNQGRALMSLMFGLDYLFKQIDALGMTDQVYVLVGSDFGRTPYYNKGNGKDHWNITSMMMAGPNIKGDRVIGGTDAGFVSTPINLKTLQPGGSDRLSPNGIHLALRKLAGIAGTDIDKQFGLPGDPLPLFT
jgi:hypothetical protein